MTEDSKAPEVELESTTATKIARKRSAKKATKRSSRKPITKQAIPKAQSNYPRHALDRALRLPRAILDQNAGKDCSDAEVASFLGVKLSGELSTEISSCIKFGLFERPTPKQLRLTDLAKRILRPQQPTDEIQGLREAILKAPVISNVYQHYRGENLPDQQFFDNALVDKFGVPANKIFEFKPILIESLKTAQLIEDHGGKDRVIDTAPTEAVREEHAETLKKLGKSVSISAHDTCFVVMPFAAPLGRHYELIYDPAIKKAGLRPVRADDDIFTTGKIIDQVWDGINSAKVLVAELTSRNPNVFYELGLAHALKKPVVLISSNEEDVPFDVRHIRVIYYDVNDPFWGEKLIAKVAENILSAIKTPDEAIFRSTHTER